MSPGSAHVGAAAIRENTSAVGLFQLFTLAFGAILGGGWIIGVGQWLRQAGPLGTTMGFTGGALIVCVIALCYAELGAMRHSPDGEVGYVSWIFGRSAGFLTAWLLVAIYVAVCAFEAISMGWILENIAPQLGTGTLYTLLDDKVSVSSLSIGLGSILAVAIINWRGVDISTRVQDVLTLAMLVCAAAFVGAGLFRGNAVNLAPHFAPDPAGQVVPGIVQIFVTAPFWFSGFGAVSYALGDTTAARLPKLGVIFVSAILASLAFYVVVLLAACFTIDRPTLLGFNLPAAEAFTVALGSPLLGKFVMLTGFLGLLIALNAILFAAARVLAALGEAGAVPAIFATADPHFHTPRYAVIGIAVLTALGTLAGKGIIGPLVNVAGIAISLLYVLIAAGTLRLRFADPQARRPFRPAGGLLVPILATSLAALLAVMALCQPMLEPHGRMPLQWTLLLAWAALGCLLRFVTAKRRATVSRTSVT